MQRTLWRTNPDEAPRSRIYEELTMTLLNYAKKNCEQVCDWRFAENVMLAGRLNPRRASTAGFALRSMEFNVVRNPNAVGTLAGCRLSCISQCSQIHLTIQTAFFSISRLWT